ncbi:THO complex subunit 4C-like [Gastrolobium bilobum]|uniref:THO complex subunit 4C-like n=1 Tax=Gastrolobium bilobum TaxID=150636 RepID=UPI002AB2F244|nr:THO complex subunit 4C-like [Gastrolobium bilobum]
MVKFFAPQASVEKFETPLKAIIADHVVSAERKGWDGDFIFGVCLRHIMSMIVLIDEELHKGKREKSSYKESLPYTGLRTVGIQGIELSTKLYVSNLDHGVPKDDIRGSAEVLHTRSDAFAALKRFSNVLLDGKPMKIEIVGANAELAISARVNITGVNGQRKSTVVTTNVIPR